MPMRGTLPLCPNDAGEDKTGGQLVSELIESRDFTVVSLFALAGVLLSMYLIVTFPIINDVMALFAQFP